MKQLRFEPVNDVAAANESTVSAEGQIALWYGEPEEQK
jgi:hypothetical protein